MIESIILTIIGLISTILAGLSAVYLLKSAAGLTETRTDSTILKWLVSVSFISGVILIIISGILMKF